MSDVTIEPVTTPTDLAAVRELCWAYRDFLLAHSEINQTITETFYPVSKYTALMDNLEQEHARPKGMILLARARDGTALGCGMTHAINPQTAEIKRVFVTPAARGKGVAAQICTTLMAQAKADDFKRIVLDTSKNLHDAQRLYLRLGFRKCGPYQPIPEHVLPELVFFEKAL